MTLEQRRIQCLQKRSDWLEARVVLREDSGKRADFDSEELATLRWAIPIIKEYVRRRGEAEEAQE